MHKRILVLLILILLLLTACSGGQETETPVDEAAVTEEAAPAPTNTAAILPTEAPQIEAEETPEEAEETDTAIETAFPEFGVASECTMVSALPDPPAQFAEILTISEDDWVHGPDTAVLTIIEYADFQ